jgi:hypothetical protein
MDSARPALMPLVLPSIKELTMRHALGRRLGLALLVPLVLSGCFLVAAGAGAGAAIAYTNRGASSTVHGSVDDVFTRSVAAFAQTGVTKTGESTEDSGAKRKLVGSKSDLEVTVEMSRATDSTTSVEVYAQKNAVQYDKDFAKDVLNRIIQ